MEQRTWKDCYVRWDDGEFILGNSRIERKYRFYRQSLVPLSVEDKKTGVLWKRENEGEAMPLVCGFLDEALASLSITAGRENHGGLSEDFFHVILAYQDTEQEALRFEREFDIYPELPFITMHTVVHGDTVYGNRERQRREHEFNGVETAYGKEETRAYAQAREDCIDTFPLPKGHYKIREAQLIDKSDIHDFLVREITEPMYSYGWAQLKIQGDLFMVDDYVHGNTLMLVKEAPTHLSALHYPGYDFCCSSGKVIQLVGTGLPGEELDGQGVYGYGSTVGVGTSEDILRLYRRYYRAAYKGNACGSSYVMSNTWGDCHNDTVVCHDFIVSEINAAAEMGVDAVQIDDGWQKGITSNSALVKNGVWEGYYAVDPDFWTINEKKFPQGLKPVVEYAKSKGVEIGLWFSPDSSNSFANYQKDAEVLLFYYRTYGIRYFKLDGVKIRDKIGERNYLKFLEEVSRRSDNQIGFNQDITAEDRLGHIYFKQFGTLFVENRYSDRGSYYPHNVLKNLWQLSRYFPACKFQFELLNNQRSKEVYGEDPFAPANYTMDYLFATTMMANPLVWMEMTFLPQREREQLAGIIKVYREHRRRLFHADVSPVGQMPDGQSFTGFHARCEDGSGYLLLFREASREKEHVFHLPELSEKEITWEILATNGDANCFVMTRENGRDEFLITMGEQRTYVFLKYGIKGE